MQELRELRVGRGYSQRQLAARSGIDQGAISDIESGKRSPSVVTLERLVKAMDAEMADLFPKVQASLFDDEQRHNPFLEAWVSSLRRLADGWKAGIPDQEELRANPQLAFDVLSRNELVQAEVSTCIEAAWEVVSDIPPGRWASLEEHRALASALYRAAVISERWDEAASIAVEVVRKVTELHPDLAPAEESFERATENRRNSEPWFEELRSAS